MLRSTAFAPNRDRPAGAGLAIALVLLLLFDVVLLVWLPHAPLLLAVSVSLAGGLWLAGRLPIAVALLAFGLPLFDPVARAIEGEEGIAFAVRAVVLLSFGWFALVSLDRPGRAGASIASDPVVLLALLFWAVLALGALETPSPGYARLKLIQYGITHVPLLIGGSLIGRRHDGEPEQASRRRFESFLVAILVLTAAMAAVGLLNVRYRFYEYHQRLGMLGINPIWIARTMGVGLVAAVALIRYRRIGPLVGMLAFVPIAAVLVLSGSRAPLIGLLLLGAGWLVFRGGWSFRRAVGAALVIATVGAVAVLAMPEPLRDRFLRPFSGDVASYVRLRLLRIILDVLAGVPVLGVGTGGFSWILRMGDIRAYPHNLFAEIWIENGLPGLAALVAFLATGIVRAVRRFGDPPTALALGLFLYALWNAQLSGDVTSNEWIWLFAGLIAGRTR